MQQECIGRLLIKIFKVTQFSNAQGFAISVLDYGCTITRLLVPIKNRQIDVALGLQNPQDYTQGHPFLGSIVGRCANRIANGAFDFTTPKTLRGFIKHQEKLDHNFCFDASGFKKMAQLKGNKTQIEMEVRGTQEGLQFYNDFKLGRRLFVDKNHYPPLRECVETQSYPKAINCPHFKQPVLNPKESYEHKTIYRFKV